MYLTVIRYVKKAKDALEQNPDFDLSTLVLGHDTRKVNGRLLNPEELEILRDLIKARDLRNDGMTRKDVIEIIAHMAQTSDLVKAENHYDYLIRSDELQDLKRGGRVVTAQKTTTKRGEVTYEQQFRAYDRSRSL